VNIKAIVFDYGGVICFVPSHETEEELAGICGLTAQMFRELHLKFRGELDRGSYNVKEFYRHHLPVFGVFPEDEMLDKIAQADMESWKNINPETLRLMRDIKGAGFTLGILSNMHHEFLAWMRANTAILEPVDTAVFSCNYNLIKPETAIYEKLKELLGCEYQEIVFFDDLPDNITKARELGIHGFIWEGPGQARKLLKNLNAGFESL